MNIIPTQEETIDLFMRTGGFRKGHFEFPDGRHGIEYLQVALTMRYYESAKILSVGLSRLLRADSEIRAQIGELSIVAPATGGLPVAYGVCEALRARQVYWAERENEKEPLHFRQFLEVKPGEKVVLVDDILRTGRRLTELKNLVERLGAEVVGVAVIIHQPAPNARTFGPIPFFALAKLDHIEAADPVSCPQCARGVPLEKIRN